MKLMKINDDRIEEIGDNHVGTSAKTPLRPDAFDISDDEKIERIQESVKDILITLGMDLEMIALKVLQKEWLNLLLMSCLWG